MSEQKTLVEEESRFIVLDSVNQRVVGSVPDMKTLYAFSDSSNAERFIQRSEMTGVAVREVRGATKLKDTARRIGFAEVLWDHTGSEDGSKECVVETL